MADDRSKNIQEFIRRLSDSSLPDARGLVEDANDGKQALYARDLTGEALAQQIMKNTGVPIPSDKASNSQVEDFLNRIAKEHYPEIDDPKIRLNNDLAGGEYYDKSKQIYVGNQDNPDMLKKLRIAMHEMGHRYDDDVLKYQMPESLMNGENGRSQLDRAAMWDYASSTDKPNPLITYQKGAKGHHARIPNLRDANSFELGALKSMMKNGTFKAAGPVLGVASNIVPSIADLKEGNPNTAMARMATSLAPAGTGELDKQLMEQAAIADKSPELQDPSYLNTLKNIGARREREGRSPVVESFSGQQVDTAATEGSDFENRLKAIQKLNSQG